MKILAFLVIALSLGGSVVRAQTTEVAIAGRLMGKPLQLRGFWMDDNLKFDAVGTPMQTYRTGSFTESGFNPRKIELKGNHLEVEGDREGLLFNEDDMAEDGTPLFNRVALHKKGKKTETVKIEVDAGADGDFSKALDTIFAPSLAELAPDVPMYWQEFFQTDVLHKRLRAPVPTGDRPFKIGGTLLPPKVVKQVNPHYSETARELKISGHTFVHLIVNREGMPERISVERPAGLGLDEQAVSAVGQYVFKPATKNGEPVTVELTIEVNFQIY